MSPSPSPRVVALVPAAGAGTRLGDGDPKALRLLAGRALLTHAVEGLLASGVVDAVVVAVPPGRSAAVAELLDPSWPLLLVDGGATRQESVRRALDAAPGAAYVLVHDAARCLTPPDVVRRVVGALQGGAAAVVPGVPAVDTTVTVGPGGDGVTGRLDRATLRLVQTPQGFSRALLERAHAAARPDAAETDDAGLVAALGEPVVVVAGDAEAFKVTRPLDLLLAEAVLARRTGAVGEAR